MSDEPETYTPEQIEAMRQTVAEYDAEQAAAAAAAEAARLKPLRDYTHADAYVTMAAGIDAINTQYGTEPAFTPHIQCLLVGLPALAAAAGPYPVDPDA